MAIVSSPDEPPHPAPRSLHRLATTRHTGRGVYEVALGTGAELADVFDALGAVPIDTDLVGVKIFGDVDVDGDTVLVFRQVPPVAALTPRRGPRGGAPADPVQQALIDLIAV